MMLPALVLSLLLAAATAKAPARHAATGPPASTATPSGPMYPNPEAVIYYVAGRLAEERGDDGEAMTEFLHALALDPNSRSAMLRVSELAARRGDAGRSLEFAERDLALEPGDPRALWLKGSAQFNLGHANDALETLEAAARADSTQTQYWLTLGRVAEHLDRIDMVERSYSHVVALDEDDAEAWFQMAAAAARLGHYSLADSALSRSVDLNPARPGQVFLRGWIRENTGRRSEAIDLYRHHLELHPDDQATRTRLVDLLTREQRYAEAYPEAKRLSRARPDDPDALENEASLAYKLNRPRDGAAALDRLRALGPQDPALVGRAMGVLGHNGRSKEAVAMANDWARAHPLNYRGDMLIAQALVMDKQIDAGIAHARAAVAAAPDSLGPRVLLGRMLQGEKRWPEAEAVWAEAVARFPTLGGLGLDLAFCREQRGDLDGAETAVRDVLKREPDNASALNFLGYLLADHNRNLEEAESLIRRAVDQDPDNGAYLDSLGWVYYRLGRLNEARENLERAARLTGDPVVHEHLGDVYKDLKLLELARDQYTRALAGDSSNARLRSKLAGAR